VSGYSFLYVGASKRAEQCFQLRLRDASHQKTLLPALFAADQLELGTLEIEHLTEQFRDRLVRSTLLGRRSDRDAKRARPFTLNTALPSAGLSMDAEHPAFWVCG
jgi:hypothetical protein